MTNTLTQQVATEHDQWLHEQLDKAKAKYLTARAQVVQTQITLDRAYQDNHDARARARQLREYIDGLMACLLRESENWPDYPSVMLDPALDVLRDM